MSFLQYSAAFLISLSFAFASHAQTSLGESKSLKNWKGKQIELINDFNIAGGSTTSAFQVRRYISLVDIEMRGKPEESLCYLSYDSANLERRISSMQRFTVVKIDRNKKAGPYKSSGYIQRRFVRLILKGDGLDGKWVLGCYGGTDFGDKAVTTEVFEKNLKSNFKLPS